jgi:hypothetical protein
LTATGEALIRLDGHSISHVDRALRGKGTFTIKAVWGRAGFAIHSNETSMGNLNKMLHWLNPAYIPQFIPHHFQPANMLVKALSAEAHNEVYAREIFVAT